MNNLFALLAATITLNTLALAAPVTGTVTNKTTGKPSGGDLVELVDVQAGMGVAAKTTTSSAGKYTLNAPGQGPYLVRATHQGSPYFIAAPDGGAPGNITVYDAAAKVAGVSIEADVMEVEAANGQLKVTERYFVHNKSTPPTTQWSKKSFEVTLPDDAIVDGVGGQRPAGLPTSIKMQPEGAKGHYVFDFPIQPDEADKDTLFQIAYHLPYSSGKYAFHQSVALPADNMAVLLPKSMTLDQGAGAQFKSVPEDPKIQTFVMKTVAANTPVAFTVSGEGSIPREEQGAAGDQQSGGTANNGTVNNGQPGGGLGEPTNTPDPLSKYKWWILGALALIFSGVAAYMLRKPQGPRAAAPAASYEAGSSASYSAASYQAAPAGNHNQALLAALKEELFSLESDKLSGKISEADYAEMKPALETVLKRALKRN